MTIMHTMSYLCLSHTHNMHICICSNIVVNSLISYIDFTEEEHKKFQMRLGEGYDLKDDERYNKWRKWKESAGTGHVISILCLNA